MRLLVCGSRNTWDAAECWAQMDKIQPVPELVIAGGASGIDTFAETWALRRGIPCMVFNAAWDGPSGRAAGPIRNGWMIKYGRPDLVLALPGGVGTENMMKQAKAAGIEVRKVGSWK